MSKEDEAERQTLMRRGIIPARPKGAPGPTPPPLDDLLKRRQTMQGVHHGGPRELNFTAEDNVEGSLPVREERDPFEAFVEIMRVLRTLPKKQRKLIIEMFADLMD